MARSLLGSPGTAALAFRGYNITNLGKTPELLQVPAYRPFLVEKLREAAEIYQRSTGRPVDLVERIEKRIASDLASFGIDAAVIVAVSLAHLEIMEKLFQYPTKRVRATFGYSLGELPALILGGVFTMDQILTIPLSMADDCASLAPDVSMGVLFTRGRALDATVVRRLCAQVCAEGDGLIAPSAVLAPNATLLLAEGDALKRFQTRMASAFTERVMIRRNQHKWPPLHTPLVWRQNLAERGALATYKIGGGFVAPVPAVISCVTGKASYNDYNSREILTRWIDHPQLLWEVIHETLVMGIETIIHIGPEPNLIPSTYERIALDVSTQIGKNFMGRFGERVITSIAQRPWLTSLLTKDAALLRAPFIEHIKLEDWLLEHAPK